MFAEVLFDFFNTLRLNKEFDQMVNLSFLFYKINIKESELYIEN